MASHADISATSSCELPPHSDETAARVRDAGLVFTSDCLPGIRRVPVAAGGFAYRTDTGRRAAARDVRRAEALHIPPAWSDVWICADEHGHLQATGRDARGRKQYRYHAGWQALRDATKYERMVVFGRGLPKIRARVDRDLRRPAPDRERVLALVVAVLDRSLIRVGNQRYARENDSFGLTTLRVDHATAGATRVELRFRGKAGKPFEARIDDPRIARAVKRVAELPGHELFQYADQRGVHVVGSADVNEYLRETTGESVTSKDFRTWGGSLVAALHLVSAEGPPSTAAVTAAVKEAASVLGNTPAVCRRSYINPRIIELYHAGELGRVWRRAERTEHAHAYLSEQERVFLGVLRVEGGAAGRSSRSNASVAP